MGLPRTAGSFIRRCNWGALVLASITGTTATVQGTDVVHLDENDGGRYSPRGVEGGVCKLQDAEQGKAVPGGSMHSGCRPEGLEELCGQAGRDRVMSVHDCQEKLERFCQRHGSEVDMNCLRTASQHRDSFFNHHDADDQWLSGLDGVAFLSPADGWTGVSDMVLARFAVRHPCFPATCSLAIHHSGRTVTIDQTMGRWSTRPLSSGGPAYVIEVDLVAPPGTLQLSALLTSSPSSSTSSDEGGGGVLSQTPIRSLTLLSQGQCTPRAPVPSARVVRVFDAFLFSSELDMLELHLHELADVVDIFVLVEATHTFQGQPKALVFEAHKHERRFARFAGRIEHVIVRDSPTTGSNAWDREYHQRNALLRGLDAAGAEPTDVVIIGDVDEVARPSVLRHLLHCADVAFPVSLLLADHNYNFHWRKRDPSFLSVSLVSLARLVSPVVLRRVMVGQGLASGETELISQDALGLSPTTFIADAGWHMSYFMTPEEISRKVQAFAHAEYNTPQFRDTNYITSQLAQGLDLFGRSGGDEMAFHLTPDLPTYLQHNLERFHSWAPHLPIFPPGATALESRFLPSGLLTPLCCEGEGPCDVFLAVGIVSHAAHADRRDAIRATWLARLYDTNFAPHFRHRFLVGVDAQGEVSRALLKEAQRHKDLLIIRNPENYANVYYKEVAAFRWGAEECGAWLVLRANDDVYLDLPPVLLDMQRRGPRGLYAGHFLTQVAMLRPGVGGAHGRSVTVNPGQYPFLSYPPFVQGNAVLVSRDVAQRVGALSRDDRHPRLPGDVAVGLVVGLMGPAVEAVHVPADFAPDGATVRCNASSLFHFDLPVGVMRAIHDNLVHGRPRCQGIGDWHQHPVA